MLPLLPQIWPNWYHVALVSLFFEVGKESVSTNRFCRYRMSTLDSRLRVSTQNDPVSLNRFSILSATWLSSTTSQIVDSPLLVETTLMQANVYWRECMRRLTAFALEVPARHHACWWHGIAGARCTTVHILEPQTMPRNKRNRKGACSTWSHLGTHRFSGSTLPPEV